MDDNEIQKIEELYLQALRKKMHEKAAEQPQESVKLKPSPKINKTEYQGLAAGISTEPEKKPRGRPKKEQPVQTPPSTPIEEPKTLQNYNKAYYAEKKHEIAKKKLLKRIEKGENISDKLLAKYNLS